MLPDQVNDAPPAVPLFKVGERECRHFRSPEAAAEKYGQDGAVAQAMEGRDIRCTQQSLGLPERKPVPDADALRLGAFHAADADGQFRRQQPVVGGLRGQFADRRHSIMEDEPSRRSSRDTRHALTVALVKPGRGACWNQSSRW